MSRHAGALAEAQVAAVRDDPAARIALMARVFRGPPGRAPRHLPFRRAALSFMRWQARRGLLNPLDASPPGSVWWRAVNERLLRDGCETVALLGGLDGEPSSRAVRLWLEFAERPTGRNWYRAHNASIVAGYLEHRQLAGAEGAPERFFINVVLVRVLYAHALGAAPRLALGRFAPLGRLLGDPRLGMAGIFLSLRRVLPNRYPLALDVERYIADEQRPGRILDYAVIVPRRQHLYEWSAEELGEPRLLELVRDGNPTYAWPFEQRHVWRAPEMTFAAWVLERATRAADRSRLLAHDLARGLVEAQPEEGRVTQPAVGRPFHERDLRHELGIDPRRGARDALLGLERGCLAHERSQLLGELAQRRAGEARSDLAGVAEAVAVEVADQQGAEVGARAARRGEAADHELL
jgi:hypothetical protein